MELSKQPMTYKQFAATKSQLVTELQLTPLEWLKLLGPNLDSTGNPQNLLSTAGAVTETNSSNLPTILTNLTYVEGINGYSTTSFGAPIIGQVAAHLLMSHRIAVVPFTSDGSGAVAFQAVVPALAGYTGHCKWLGTWFDTTDAALTITWSVAAGTLLGPAVHAIACTANCVTQAGAVAANQVGMPIPLRGTIAADDNKNLGFAIAGYGNTNNGYVIAEYWYET